MNPRTLLVWSGERTLARQPQEYTLTLSSMLLKKPFRKQLEIRVESGLVRIGGPG
jgi:hypothetical protein